jgi:ankyrin repeat protein
MEVPEQGECDELGVALAGNPEVGPVKLDNRAVASAHDQSHYAQDVSSTEPLKDRRGGNGEAESARVGNNKNNLDQRHRGRRLTDRQSEESNVPAVDYESRQIPSPAATSKSSTDPNLEWALVRYGSNPEGYDANANWDRTLVSMRGINSFNAGLHLATREGDIRLARYCLDNGADIESKSQHGQTALHLAVLNVYEYLVLLLLERGADVEAAMDNGARPLYIAAFQGHAQIAKLLLRAHADTESWNPKTRRTALCQAITNNHFEIVKLLLDGGVEINGLTSDGYSPLYTAARNNNPEIVELLLEYGADKNAPLRDGTTVEDHVEHGSSVAMVLRRPPIRKGPSVNAPKMRSTPSITFPRPLKAPRQDQYDKLAACYGFEATIVDFFLDAYQDEERRIAETASIYDTLYERGPDRIMSEARGNRLQRQKPAFRWYHLPANNVRILPF